MIIAVASPSASGKTTLVTQALEKFNLHRLITTTTRKPRVGESDKDYHFVSVDEFNALKEANEFIEYNEVYGNLYGLTKTEITSHIHETCIVILDVGGVDTIKTLFPDVVKTIFIMPESVDDLKMRLSERGDDTDEIGRRLAEIDREISEAIKYDYIHINGNLTDSIETFNNLIKFIDENQ